MVRQRLLSYRQSFSFLTSFILKFIVESGVKQTKLQYLPFYGLNIINQVLICQYEPIIIKRLMKEQDWRKTIRQTKQSEPLKFKLLSMVGLKEYLIDKYVFYRVEPQYQIIEEEGRKKIKCQFPIKEQTELYKTQVISYEDETHSIPVVKFYLKNRQDYSGTVIYSHGNSSDLYNSLNFISMFLPIFPKFDFVAYDYSGYGRSTKKQITQQSIVSDILFLLEELSIPDRQIILWGFSLGAFPSAKAAVGRKFKGVILQSPLASIYSLFEDNLTPYSSFDNDHFSIISSIAQIPSFLLIIHSQDDEIIPFSHSKMLYERYQIMNSNPFCFFLQTAGLKHNHFHGMICDKQSNQVKSSFLSYLKLMIDSHNLPAIKMFSLLKNKYFCNLGQIQNAQNLNVDQKATIKSSKQFSPRIQNSFSFSAYKQERVFEYDEISSQDVVDFNYYMDVKAIRHVGYFKQSEEAKEQTDSPAPKQKIPSIIKQKEGFSNSKNKKKDGSNYNFLEQSERYEPNQSLLQSLCEQEGQIAPIQQ